MGVKEIQGSNEELEFWAEFVKTPQFATWLRPGQPAPELDPLVVHYIRQEGGKVLDVGSGAVSILFGVVGNSLLTATDVLAAPYLYLLEYEKLGIKPPIAVSAEDLSYYEEFHVVHMRNAFDHTQNPMLAYDKLKRAVRLGGLLIIHGFENEGSFLHGLGMHQWDLEVDGDRLRVTSVQTKNHVQLDPYPLVPLVATTTTLPNGRRWLTWIARKPSVHMPE